MLSKIIPGFFLKAARSLQQVSVICYSFYLQNQKSPCVLLDMFKMDTKRTKDITHMFTLVFINLKIVLKIAE